MDNCPAPRRRIGGSRRCILELIFMHINVRLLYRCWDIYACMYICLYKYVWFACRYKNVAYFMFARTQQSLWNLTKWNIVRWAFHINMCIFFHCLFRFNLSNALLTVYMFITRGNIYLIPGGPLEFPDLSCWGIGKLQIFHTKKQVKSEIWHYFTNWCKKECSDTPTIITPRGSAKPERLANLKAFHLLSHKYTR